ncbi:cytochrome P450 monooxygenase [Aspergillus heterothallicus]
MAAVSQNAFLVLAGITGVTTHVALYRHGEWDVAAPKVATAYILLLLGAVATDLLTQAPMNVQRDGVHFSALKAVLWHIVGIYGSMLVYRGAFHRLSEFPGPFLARLSNFYVTGLSARRLHLYEEIEKLHKQYGDYVRLGPTELSITDPKAVQALYSGQSKVSKGPWYTILEPRVSLQTDRDRKEHARRRKVWDQGFSSRALRDYEPRVSHYTDQLIDAIERNLGSTMDVSKWFNYYSFDVMGDLAFGESFNMLVDGKDAYILTQLHGDMKMIGLFSHLTWLFPFFKRIPGINADYLKFWEWVTDRVNGRIKNFSDRPDVFSWILKAYEKSAQTARETMDLHGDAYLIIVAGSDTTAAVLTSVFYHLAADPILCKKLQNELDNLSEQSHDKLASASLLNAVINETLRLHPAVPSGTQRQTPPEGISIGSTHIPGDVMVCVPIHTVFRDERNFARPDEFLPERWTTNPELVKDPSVFIPFNGGPYACVGKQLALMELRQVIFEVLKRFELSFAPGQTKSAFLDGKQDTFTLVTPQLNLVFGKR